MAQEGDIGDALCQELVPFISQGRKTRLSSYHINVHMFLGESC
jgi:hypothetical protein